MKTILDGVLHMTLAGSLVILVVLLARPMLCKAPKRFSYALWAVVLVRLLCPVGIPVRMPQGALPQAVPVTTITTGQAEIPKVPTEAVSPQQSQLDHSAAAQEVPAASEDIPISWESVVAAVWAVGALSMVLYGGISNFRFRKTLEEACKIGDSLYIVDGIGSAFVVGLFRPRIYLDSGISGERMQYIVAHEQTHIARWDHVTRHLAYLALCLHWFNPLVWLAFFLSGRDMEMSCDEAVVGKLGPQIRANYAESLVNLSLGRHILAGRPVAFGENDTRRRIMNLANWKHTNGKFNTLCGVLCLAVTVLCACQPVGSAKPVAEKPTSQETVKAENPDSFESTDGSVTYTWNLGEIAAFEKLPVVEVVPHKLTDQDAQRMAKVFYGDAPVYDIGVGQQRQLTRKEIQRRIDFLTPYLDTTKLGGLWTLDDAIAQPDRIQPDLETMQEQLKTAPEEIQEPLWDGTVPEQPGEGYENLLNLFGYVDGDPYRFTARCDEEGPYQENGMMLLLNDGGEENTASFIGDAQVFAGGPPAAGKPEELSRWAQEKLDQMAPGAWQVAGVRIRKEVQNSYSNVTNLHLGESVRYYINVDATPMTHGVPGIFWPTSQNLEAYQYSLDEDWEDDSASYPDSYAYFAFNADGKLNTIGFVNPEEEVRQIQENVEILPMEQLIRIAQEQLTHYNDKIIASGTCDPFCDVDLDAVDLQVEIHQGDFGMARIPAEDRPGHFYRVPAISFRGQVYAKDKETGEMVEMKTVNGGTLVTINAMDGTVIG